MAVSAPSNAQVVRWLMLKLQFSFLSSSSCFGPLLLLCSYFSEDLMEDGPFYDLAKLDSSLSELTAGWT